jgi:phosphoglycerol transferase MdoB-like AlkP superfamily enzyme
MLLCFLIISEFTFWLEFSTRFNFIAVDYLVYTHEVLGNIQESYPIFVIFPLMILIGSIIFYKLLPLIKAAASIQRNFKTRCYQFISFTFIAIASFFFYEPKITDIKENNYLSELSKNGLYNLFSAFLHNSIDYYALYQTKDTESALSETYKYINQSSVIPDESAQSPGDLGSHKYSLKRHIQAKGAPNNLNVILITVESLSADFLKAQYGNKPLTPVINDLMKKSIYFNNFYATGTRTVRGLEAITLSIPPIPGQSILRRENNENLFSIASVLNKENYNSKFIYGGYGYFDNMNYFFSHNGFKIIDRNVIPEKEVNFANIWGISDEDLYKQAIKQADSSFARDEKFFSLVMTTSNHRPYTYPEGKIDIPSKSNREGGVKYSDYAIGEFLKQAETKPWFDNTIFVITADHCAGSAGKVALPPHKYHIPLLIYAPKLLKPEIISKLSSQIDLAPTILGLLNISYDSKFFGNDIFSKTYENAFISTFQKLGYIENNKLVVLSPAKQYQTYNLLDNNAVQETVEDPDLTNRAINYYQSSYYLYQKGLLKEDAK